MRKLLLLLLLGIIVACNVDDNCSPEEFYSTITTGKEIVEVVSQHFPENVYTIVDGNKLVFSYNHVGFQCDDVYDDEWGEELTFQIDSTVAEFNWVDSQIETAQCFYRQYGAWVNAQQIRINKGTVEGIKISSNRWSIKVNIEVTYPSSNNPIVIKFARTFTLN